MLAVSTTLIRDQQRTFLAVMSVASQPIRAGRSKSHLRLLVMATRGPRPQDLARSPSTKGTNVRMAEPVEPVSAEEQEAELEAAESALWAW